MPRVVEVSDGTAETVLVRELEEQFANRDNRWLNSEHARLAAELASPRGIRRRNWLRLQAVNYLIRAGALSGTRDSRKDAMAAPRGTVRQATGSRSRLVQLWLWPGLEELLRQSRRLPITTTTMACYRKKERRTWKPSKAQLCWWPS